MLRIEAIPNEASPLAEQARALFRLYSDFLRDKLACGTFNFAKFDEEIAALPTPYASLNGEVILALIDDVPAAVISYRAADRPQTCEIKRLYVHPDFRGQRLSRTLVNLALDRARSRNFTHAILDTDTINMSEAHALYQSLGFVEYTRNEHHLAFLERSL